MGSISVQMAAPVFCLKSHGKLNAAEGCVEDQQDDALAAGELDRKSVV